MCCSVPRMCLSSSRSLLTETIGITSVPGHHANWVRYGKAVGPWNPAPRPSIVVASAETVRCRALPCVVIVDLEPRLVIHLMCVMPVGLL